MEETLTRYSVIDEKNQREIVLLRGNGCKWGKCRFCNYHQDFSKNEEDNTKLNIEILKKVQGIYKKLEVINSGSFCELNEETIKAIEETCIRCSIHSLNFESHWIYKEKVAAFRERFKKIGVVLKIKIGVESFDYDFRETYLAKGLTSHSPKEISEYFDEACLLQGLEGQTVEGMIKDIDIGLKYFERVCVNIMVENGMPVKPDEKVIKKFIAEVYPLYKDNERIDILLNNTDFGVG